MLSLSRKYFRVFCIMLTIHIVALNTCGRFYIDFISQSSISKDYDLEEDSESKTNSDKIDDLMDDYIISEQTFEKYNTDVYFLETPTLISSNQHIIALSQGDCEVQIPPPRA